MVGAALPPDGAAGPAKRSFLPILIAVLLAAVVIVGLAIVALLLLSGSDNDMPTVAIQSPTQGAEIAVGTEVLLQATAAGARDITRLEIKVDDVLAGVSTSPDPAGTGALTINQPWTFSQAGPHAVTATAYTAANQVSDPASVEVTIIELVAQETPTATASATPTTEAPSDTPTPTSSPTGEPLPDTPTPSATPTSTPTPTPTNTPIPPPQIEYFRVTPANITAGECATLEWGTVTNATQASIDQGIGGVGTPGTSSVCPTETTTYILTATGPGGTATASTTLTVQAALPDLTVASILFVPDPPVQGQDNQVRITLQNIGSGPAGPFRWEWQPGTAVPLGGTVPGGLNAGQSLEVSTVWRPGSWYANLPTVARVDVDDDVAESDETNNELQVNVEVVPPADVTVTLYGQAALDGFQANNGGGNTSADIRFGNGIMVGSPSYELVTRGFMSFDLSGIPASADVKSIELRFFQAQVTGDPYGKLGNPLLKHVDYGSSLENADYNGPELASAILSPRTSAGQWYIITSSTLADWIEQDLAAGRTRFQGRLQFSTETDGDGIQDSVSIESGDNALGTGNLPTLTFTYAP
jgi:outer membrane biosynthesis protein TonB